MIDCFDNIFSDRIVNGLWDKYRQFPFIYYWKSDRNLPFNHWNHSIIQAGTKYNVEDIQNQFEEKQKEYQFEYNVWQQIKNKNPESILLRVYVNAYTHGTDTAPHTDSNRENEQTHILYLNKEWKPLWCGETVIFDKTQSDIEKSYLPKFNRLITFPSNRLHAARPIHKSCNELRIVLVLKTSTENKYTKYMKSVGAHKIPHSGRTLLEHLWGTYTILKREGHSEYICLAGLFHSIYGTNKFTHKSETNRDVIKNLIGEDAERLVWLFSDPDRVNKWDNLPITQDDKTALKIIDAVNIGEQK